MSILYKHQGSRLPEGYTEVEYIESSGTQWIDTGYTPNQDTTFEAKANLVSGNNFDGIAYVDSATHNAYGFFCFNNQLGCYYNSLYNINSGYVGVDKTYKLDKNLLYIDDILTHTFNQTTFTSYGSLRLFAMRRATTNMGYAHTKLYYNKIWDNGTLVRDLVPAKRLSDNEIGMYDKANSGKNLLNPEVIDKMLNRNDGITLEDSAGILVTNYIDTSTNKTFTLSNGYGAARIYKYGENGVFLNSSGTIDVGNTITFDSNVKSIRLQYNYTGVGVGTKYLQFEVGSSATEYEPYPFYTNAGTGTFIPGPEVDPYQYNVYPSGIKRVYYGNSLVYGNT